MYATQLVINELTVRYLSNPCVPGCKGVSWVVCEDERDIMVPGEQLWDPAPAPQGDDLRGPGGL